MHSLDSRRELIRRLLDYGVQVWWIVSCVSPRNRDSELTGEETWLTWSGTSRLKLWTLRSKTSTSRCSWVAWTRTRSSGDTLLVTWHPVVLPVPRLCVSSILWTSPEPGMFRTQFIYQSNLVPIDFGLSNTSATARRQQVGRRCR